MKADAPSVSYRAELALLAAATAVLAALALLPPVIGLYQTQLLTYGLIAAIAALGFNLLLGYTGLLSFGHSAFFGLGAYTIAFLLRYFNINSMESYIVLGLPVVAIASVMFGYISVRHTRIFFGILTLALSQVLYSLALKLFWVTGGTDGLRVARPTLLFGQIGFAGPGSFQRFINTYYYYVLAIFAICVVVMWVIVHSPFGKALQAIRDNETRAAFLGLRIRRFRLAAFTISGTFTGLAGILWAPLNGLATPDVLYWTFSGEIVFTALLGGFRNFTGPIVGGIVFTYLKTYAVATTEYWQALLGTVLVLLVILLPTGIVGALSQLAGKLRAKGEAVTILLQTVDLRKQFGETRACDGVNFVVHTGEFLSLVGSNGAGKTSLVNLISAHLQPDSGKILFEGNDITFATVSERIKAGIARSFQIVNLFDALSVFDNVSLSIFSRQGKTVRIASLAGHDEAVRNETLEVLGQFGLRDKSEILAGGLAQGERKLLDVAIAYALRPKLLFLDEPTSGVSTHEKAQIMDTVSTIVRAGTVTAVIIEHDMDVVFRYSDRIVMMHEGSFLADGTPEEIKANKDVANILLGVPLSA